MVAVSLKKNFFKQKTAYEIDHCDWSSDVCSSDLPILWPPDVKNQLIGKDPDAGKERLRAGGEGDNRG